MENDLLGVIAEYGLLGAILTLVLLMAFQLGRELKQSWESRLTENRQMVQVMEATNNMYSALAAATENRARATEAVAEAQVATARALEAQIEVLRRLETQQQELLQRFVQIATTAEELRKDTERLNDELRRSR